MGKKLEGDRAGTVDLSWPKGCSMLHDVGPSNEKPGGSVSQEPLQQDQLGISPLEGGNE